MREIDTETPVIWPAWCYSGEASIENSTLAVGSQANALAASTAFSKNKGKRKSVFANPLDKMLSDRMMSVSDNKKLCDNSGAIFHERTQCDINMDFIKNGEVTVNNNSIKSERLSPYNGEVQVSNSRSRSATPSSYPGTPPQPLHQNDINNQNLPCASLTPIKPEFQPRNYSDFIRSLAAKYNNNNANESNSSRNVFFDPRFGINTTKPTKDSPSPPDSKRLSSATPQVSSQNNLMSSIFPGISFPTTVFSPLIDMSSTQALITLARAAKEAELQTILKVSSKKPNIETTPPNNQNLNQNTNANGLLSTNQHSRFSSHNFSAVNFNQNPLRLATNEQITSPLDLSSTPITKRLKIESPSPSQSIGSPTNQQRTQSSSCRIANQRKCQSMCEEMNSWNVNQVCEFVGSIDICAEYIENFREQRIDGIGLPLLTEEHLLHSLGMKLGPALKLRSVLAKKTGGPCPCVSCTLMITTTSPSNSLPRPSSADSET